MSRSFRITLVSALLLGAGTAVSQDAATQFRLVLQHAGDTYLAHCETGCQWQELAATVPTGAPILITNQGVFTGERAPEDAPTFAFRVQHTASGWTAEPLVGTGWRSLSWNCEPATCRATLTELGVTTDS